MSIYALAGIAAAVLAVVVLGIVWAFGRSQKSLGGAKAREEAAEEGVDNARISNEIDEDIDRLSRDELIERLREHSRK